jgi:hypothetical protein
MNFLSFELCLEQKFQLRLIEQSLETMTREEALYLLTQAAELLMMKDNVIKGLVREIMQSEVKPSGFNVLTNTT